MFTTGRKKESRDGRTARAKALRAKLEPLWGHSPSPESAEAEADQERLELCPRLNDCLHIAALLDWPQLSCGSCPVYAELAQVEPRELRDRLQAAEQTAPIEPVPPAQPPLAAPPPAPPPSAPPPQEPPPQEEERSMLTKDSTLAELVDEGHSKSTVYRIANQLGITVRGRTEAEHEQLMEALAQAPKRKPRQKKKLTTPRATTPVETSAPAAAELEREQVEEAVARVGKDLIWELIAEMRTRLDMLERLVG